jgi:hypothetical protein
MKLSLKSFTAVSALSALVIAPILLSSGAASAQPVNQTKGFKDNYIGAGFAAGVTNGGQTGDAANLGINIQGRVAVPKTPVSVRGAVLYGNETTAIIPSVSVDVPIAKNTNVYGGVGYSFVEKNGAPTPLGNKDAVVLTAGAETKVAKDFVLYGDTKLGVNAYQNSPASAVSFQGGLGYRF